MISPKATNLSHESSPEFARYRNDLFPFIEFKAFEVIFG